MALLSKLKKNLSDVSNTVVKTSEVVAKVSSRMMEIQKVQHRMDNLEKEKLKVYAKLGSLYFEKYAVGDMPADMAELCEQITECQHAINEAEREIAHLRGSVICSNCQEEVSKNARYCPKCGAEIIHIVDEDDENNDEVINQAMDEEVVDDEQASEKPEETQTESKTESEEADEEVEGQAEEAKEAEKPEDKKEAVEETADKAE